MDAVELYILITSIWFSAFFLLFIFGFVVFN
jgi:hypothetical protein